MTCLRIIFPAIVLIICSTMCKNDPKETQADLLLTDTTCVDSEIVLPPQPPPEKPVPDKVVVAILEKQEKESPFKNIGCCADEEKRKSEDCCCLGLLEAYKKMTLEKRGEIGPKDPILSACREKLRQQFQDVDNPPGEPEFDH